MVPDALRPYLAWSLGAHLTAGVLLAAATRAVVLRSDPVYQIDFVGPTAILRAGAGQVRGDTAKAASPGAAAASPASDEIIPGAGRPLPRPSLTGEPAKPIADAAPAAVMGDQVKGDTTKAVSPTTTPAKASSPGSEGIATDMPNFPYPWYISQVRAGLWSQWSGRMPAASGECVIVFSILKNGSMVDLRVEESSGDSGVDLAALAAAQDAAPFPPLPRGFEEAFLKIHVTLKTQ